MLMQKLHSAWNYLCQGEFFAFVQSLCVFFLPKCLLRAEKLYLYQLTMEKSPLESTARHVVPGGAAEVQEIVESFDNGNPTMAELYRTFLERGAEPWCLQENGRILGVVWFFRKRYRIPWEGYDAYVFGINLEPTKAFVANVFVAPNSRGRGLFAEIVRAFLDSNPETTLFSSVSASNPISLRAHEKIGFRRIGTLHLLRIMNIAFGRFSLWKSASRLLRLRRGMEVEISLE